MNIELNKMMEIRKKSKIKVDKNFKVEGLEHSGQADKYEKKNINEVGIYNLWKT